MRRAVGAAARPPRLLSDVALRGRERARLFPSNAFDGAMTDADFVSYLQDALAGP